MTFVSSPQRERILAATGHVLVTGGPGCGKTTIALRKALLRIRSGLAPGERVLFLSFSRAAVARIVEAARHDLPRDARSLLEIQTFHSLFWQIVRGHGYLLGAPNRIRLLAPQDERARSNGAKSEDPAWYAERERLFIADGLLAFDLFAPKALILLKGSDALRRAVASRFPLIIVDEAQDTGTEQWECLAALSGLVQLVCLADLDQQIYDFRRDVSPQRINDIMTALNPEQVELGAENNRSPGVEIVAFANDVLARSPRGAPYKGVSQVSFQAEAKKRDACIRQAVAILNRKIVDATGKRPKNIGYLTSWGKGVAIIARALQGDGAAKAIPHRVVMDETDVLLATRVVALLMEPVKSRWDTLAIALELIAAFYRGRGNLKKAEQLERNAVVARDSKVKGAAKCPKALLAIIDDFAEHPHHGNPTEDWLALRRILSRGGVEELKQTANAVVYLMGFNRGRRIADALAEVWQRKGCYDGARDIIEAAITEDQILGGDGDMIGINVMTMHKSKGKEFDGAILLHIGNSISPFSPDKETPPELKSRRLLRVAITRARSHVLLVTDAFTRSPLLAGHKLGT